VRRFRRGPGKVDLAFALGLLVVFCVGCGTSGLPLAATAEPAQSNLQTALTGSGVFYSSNHDSYMGIGGGFRLAAEVSPISELDTGLRYISAHRASAGSNMISMYAPSSSVLVLTAYSPGLRSC
jgi:hypothetical protein